MRIKEINGRINSNKALIEVFDLIDRGDLSTEYKRDVKSALVCADNGMKQGDMKEFCDYALEAIEMASDCQSTFVTVLAFLGEMTKFLPTQDS